MNHGFYRAFEERYRGTQDVIKNRLSVYLPFILPLLEYYEENEVKAVDIGCGRGEWLDLLRENSIKATGVDLDEGMLESCYSKGLEVLNYDAIEYLKSLKDESVLVVTAFHVVEHLEFSDLTSLVNESLRVLKPGGLLILETPNPENISVATKDFYIDPTHLRPIPPKLLEFVTEYYGFERTKVLRLNEPDWVLSDNSTSMREIFCGASPDYSVVAQKKANNEITEACSGVFDNKYGTDTLDLIERWDQNYTSTVNSINEELKYLREKNETLINRVESIYSSLSWRITLPLRSFKRLLVRMYCGIKNLKKHAFLKIKVEINKYPKIKKLVIALLTRFPGLAVRLIPASNVNTYMPKSFDELVSVKSMREAKKSLELSSNVEII